MPIALGTRLGPYEILAQIGKGGMGEVYRARDAKLKRDVALKVLPEAFARDPERLARFQREAEVLASLNHPHIAAIYGIEQDTLVMELAEGESPKGPLPFDDAWKIGSQIAAALEYAHDRGIVHRDLKPANVKIAPDGTVKLLDFGLAKAFRAEKEASPASSEVSPTLTIGATEAGMILGTAAYMSPEQARGKNVDKRADVWAFGVVMYELLTGRRPFEGSDVSETLASVIKDEPDWKRVPEKAQRLLHSCLEKDPKKRLRDIGDAWRLLEQAAPAERVRHSKLPWAVSAALAVVLGIAGVSWWRAARIVDLPLTRLSVDLGPDAMTGLNTTIAISPDGRRLVFPARGPDGKQQLATRLLDQSEATLLPGTENGRDPFFSPDSQWIGFFADGKLEKISVEGGAPVILCDAPFDNGASWGEDGSIVAALSQSSGLSRVPAAGGSPQPLTRLAKGDATHRWPQILPGGQAVLFTNSSLVVRMEDASVDAISLKTGVTKALVAGAYFGRYLPAEGDRGYLVYLHQGVLFGVAFDPGRLEIQGTPVPLLEDVAASPGQGGGQFDFSAAPSAHGTFVYVEGKGADQTWPVMWLDSSGKMQPLIAAPGAYNNPRFSPDGTRLALSMGTSAGNDIFVYELERQTMTRLTFDGRAQLPVWTPDGKHIAFQSTANGYAIGWVRSDGSGETQQILAGQVIVPWSISPDGRRLACFENSPGGRRDIWTVTLDMSDPDHPKSGKPEPFLVTPSDEFSPMFSPDGRWIAYRSNESGAFETYVQPFPPGRGGKWQISTGGGLYATWSRNGRELFYESADNRIMVVDYTVSGDSFVPGKPRLWSDKQILYPGTSNLALAPDGKRFAVFPMPEAVGPEKASVHVTFLENFFDELRRRIPEGK